MISELEHSEQFRLDRERIIALGVELGPLAAEELVVSVMEELAILLARLRMSVQRKDLSDIIDISKKISEAAKKIGLSKLRRVSLDAIYLAETGDSTALAAVIERIHRLGDQSLLAVWDVTDVSL